MPLSMLATIVLGSQLVLAADVPPALDFAVGCRAVAPSKQANVQDCFRDETAARTAVAETWQQYSFADRTNCAAVATSGGTQSYVELMTCLQMAKDAKKLPR